MTQTQHTDSLSLTPEAAEKAAEFLAAENLSAEEAGLRVAVLPVDE